MVIKYLTVLKLLETFKQTMECTVLFEFKNKYDN